MKHFEIRSSPIHGNGVFATRTIQPGQFVGRYLGRRTTEDGPYTLWVDFEGELRGYDGYSRMRFLNHCGTPNAEFEERDLYALRQIEPGEEITIHYGEDWDEHQA